jgi:hypothetical protein
MEEVSWRLALPLSLAFELELELDLGLELGSALVAPLPGSWVLRPMCWPLGALPACVVWRVCASGAHSVRVREVIWREPHVTKMKINAHPLTEQSHNTKCVRTSLTTQSHNTNCVHETSLMKQGHIAGCTWSP